MKRLLIATVVLLAMMSLSLVAVRVVGAFGKSSVTMILDPGSCKQPCWKGIRPGQTTLSQVEDLLRTNGGPLIDLNYPKDDSTIRWSIDTEPPWHGSVFWWSASNDKGAIAFLELRPPKDALTLGNAILMFGEPVASTLCWRFDRVDKRLSKPFLGAHVYFKDNIDILAYDPRQPRNTRFDPNMVIWSVNYSYPADEPVYRFDTPPWKGFISAGEQDTC